MSASLDSTPVRRFAPASSPAQRHEVAHVHAGSAELKAQGYGRTCQVRWCWSDALFMAPPAWTALSVVTGDPKYLEFSDAEFWATHAALYKTLPEVGGGLFIRDTRFDSERLYWSRGNGWVFSGLKAVLEWLPEANPSRPRYARVRAAAPEAACVRAAATAC